MDWGNLFGAIGGGLGAGLAGGLFGGGDPYKKANKYWGQIPERTQPFYDPYINAGKDALGKLQGEYGSLLGGRGDLQSQFGQLMNDPTGLINKIGSQYQESPGFQWQMKQGMNAANNAAAAGGMAGSPQHQQNAQEVATGLANQDYQNFLNQGLGLYGQGLQGNLGLYGMGLQGMGGLNQMGYGASDQMARIIADMLSQQGQGAFAGQAAKNQQRGDMFGSLLGAGAKMFGGGFF